MEEIENRVLNIIANQFKKSSSEIDLDARFIEGLGGDSIDSVELMLQFEKEFGVPILKKDIKNIKTPRQAIEFFKRGKL